MTPAAIALLLVLPSLVVPLAYAAQRKRAWRPFVGLDKVPLDEPLLLDVTWDDGDTDLVVNTFYQTEGKVEAQVTAEYQITRWRTFPPRFLK